MRSDVDDLFDERRQQNDEFRDKIALDDMLQCIGNLKPGSDNIMGEHTCDQLWFTACCAHNYFIQFYTYACFRTK